MDILIRNTGDMPLYEQIVTQIKSAIVSGELEPGAPLPSLRQLARELRISVITTRRAYEELERAGFLVTMAGKGCFVAPQNTELLREEQRKKLEELLTEAIGAARLAGVTCEELCGAVRLLWDE
ncbi:MAG: GntR family transcriptional regulator [Clostridiales bacterium]|nr:GntR family transcriptional regulator [Clostridiales bacterium]